MSRLFEHFDSYAFGAYIRKFEWSALTIPEGMHEKQDHACYSKGSALRQVSYRCSSVSVRL